MAKRTVHFWVALMGSAILSNLIILDDRNYALSTEDIGIPLTNALCDDSANMVCALSFEVGSAESLYMPQCTTSDESDTLAANYEETFSSDLEWENFSFADMYNYLNCWAHASNMHKPLYSPEMWALMKEIFASQAGIDLNFHGIYDNDRLDYYSGYAEGKGRGTFAARDFSKGELVHDGSRSTIFWNDGMAWKEYIMSLPHPMACDVLEWTWIQQVQDEGWLLCLNTNDAAFFNHEDDFNIAPLNTTSLEFYAVRDIKKGDELTYDYYVFDTDWNLFDL